MTQNHPDYRDFSYPRHQLEIGWIHMGWGNFARAFIGSLANEVAEKDTTNYGVLAVAPSDRQQHDVNALNGQENIYHLLRRNGHEVCQRIGAVKEIMIGVKNAAQVVNSLASKSTHLVTLTVTKDGYYANEDGTTQMDRLADDMQALKEKKYDQIKTVPGWIMAGLFERYEKQRPPFVVMSCDNILQNGDLTRRLLLDMAAQVGNENFTNYLAHGLVCPNTAVDRITPKQNYQHSKTHLQEKYGKEDECPVICEDHIELVVEDKGKIPADMVTALEKANVTFVDNITPYQDRKVGLLNGGHMFFGLAGAIMQIPTVREAMKTHSATRVFLDKFFEQISTALQPTQPGDVHDFANTTKKRFSNPHLTDQTSRLVSATTSKVHARLLNVEALKHDLPADTSAFAIATWLRYLEARDDSGNPYSLNAPDLNTVQEKGLSIGNPRLAENLHDFLFDHRSDIKPKTMQDFCAQIVEYARQIKSVGLERAMLANFAPPVGHNRSHSPPSHDNV